jgi:signal transduction histidine kinase
MIIFRSIKSEESFARTNLVLENNDKLKNEYVLRVTHDIKGHVAAIHSCLEVIRSGISGPLKEEQQNFADRAFRRVELLTVFINDLLNLTRKKLRHGMEFEIFRLTDVIDNVVADMQILLKEKSITLSLYTDKPAHLILKGNPFSVEELYSNLLLNAIKYTPPEGKIELIVKSRLNHIISELSDNGIGILPEEQTKVFDEFYRGSNVPKDLHSGSGLGLSIAKQIIDNHKGKIWVNSEPGVWTKFTFILPKNPITTEMYCNNKLSLSGK